MAEQARLLVVDDAAEVRQLLCDYLGGQGFRVEGCGDSQALRQTLTREAPDLVLLDVGLPGEDGLSLARYLREHHDLPVIIISGAGTPLDRIIGLEVGADDYLAKPFELRELLARVRSVLRRYRRAPAPREPADGTIPLGRFRLDLQSRRLLDEHSREIELTAMEFDLLQTFAQRPNRPLTRDQLLNLTQNRDWNPFDRSIDIRIARLRRNRDGSLHWDEVHLRRASIAGTERILAFTRDITERKAAEQQRAVLEQQLRQAQRMEAIGHLTGGIAHDFNNLLTSMLGYTQMAEDLAQRQGDEQLERYLGRIRQSAEKARDLIRQMLVFSRGSRGQPRAVSLAALVEEFRPLLQSALSAGIELDLQLGTGLRPVRVDPLQLEQVLMNLCINARDAMGGSGSLAIRLGRRTQGDALCASCLQPVAGPFQVLGVQDSGPGIDERVQRTIFEPFFTTKPPGQGSGMGLSMVHGLVHEYGGHLLLHSRVGQGSCFEVLLPELDGATVVAAPLARSNGEGVGGLRGRVGVVDDDPLVCEFLTDCLRQWGLEVTAWSDAEQAGSDLLASLRDWDALILDQSMPRLSGLALAEQLLAARPGLPIALHTGFISSDEERAVHRLGLGLLHKPLDTSALHDWLGSRLPG